MDLNARCHTLVHRIKMRQLLKHSKFGMDMNILIMPILVKSTLTLHRHLIIPLMFYVVIQIAVSKICVQYCYLTRKWDIILVE